MEFVNLPLLKKDVIEKREYQENLVESFFSKGNSMIVAPTALGKTIIAAQIIAKLLEKEDKKILFLAPTKPLAVQHAETLKKVLNLPEEDIVVMTGAISPEKRGPLWKQAKIITATPQTIESDIINRTADLENTGLIIFDEAHHAVRGYAYVFIAERYMQKNPEPKILGLTASPGATREKIQEICGNLFITNIEIKSEQDIDVIPYVHKKEVTWEKIKFPKEFQDIKDNIELFMNEKVNELRSLNVKVNLKPTKGELLKLQSSFFRQQDKDFNTFQAISITAMLIKTGHLLELLETQDVKPALDYLKKLRREKTKAAKNMLSNIKMQKVMVDLDLLYESGASHPKLDKLIEIMKEEQGKNDKIIIFAHYRDMAETIRKKLEKNNIKAKKFIGQSTKGLEKGLTQKKQIEILNAFRNNEFKVLVCTSVGEEGLDIPAVDLILFYEPVSSEIRNIQRRGRTGRKKDGKIIVLMTEGTRDEAYYWISRRKEKNMKTILKDFNKIEKIKQQTLSSFVEKEPNEDRVIIFVDQRERASGITRELLKKDLIIKAKQLQVADFLLSDRLAVERKSGNDFVQSIIDGRLFSQAKELAKNFEKPLIVIEGEIYGIRRIHDNAIRGALSSLILDFNIPVFQTKSIEETTELIHMLAKREQLDSQREVVLRGTKIAMNPEEQKQFITESLPGIGPSSAKQLLKHFNNLENIFTANERELREVETIGEKRAKEIRKIISEDYQNE